jgi:glycerol uptake facilitator-like aquaporin
LQSEDFDGVFLLYVSKSFNPARDLSPRIVHAILVRGGSDWGYSWIPVAGPFAGTALAAILYGVLAPMALGF